MKKRYVLGLDGGASKILSQLFLINDKNIIISGDFNIIPEEIDVYDYEKYLNDALFKIEIRKIKRKLRIM